MHFYNLLVAIRLTGRNKVFIQSSCCFLKAYFKRRVFQCHRQYIFLTLFGVLFLLERLLLCKHPLKTYLAILKILGIVSGVLYDSEFSEVTGPRYVVNLALVQVDRCDILLAHLFHLLLSGPLGLFCRIYDMPQRGLIWQKYLLYHSRARSLLTMKSDSAIYLNLNLFHLSEGWGKVSWHPSKERR